VNVREALVRDPRVVPAGAGAREVATLLARPNVRNVLVVDGARLVGCATTDSIVAAVARGADVDGLSAGDLADGEVTTVGPDTALDEALRLMAERGLERLAVVEAGRFLGVVPRDPLVRRIAEDEAPPDGDEPLGYR
jgi:predicted transcriptional regulator